MSPRRKEVSREKYSEETISRCIQAINSGMKIYTSCKKFGIPLSTIYYRIGGRWKNKFKPGPKCVLSREEEQRIVDWLKRMQDRGFPVTRHALLFKVSEYLSSNPRITPFRNNRPGRKWLTGFMRRNPGFSFRTPEAVSAASSRVSEQDLRRWYKMVDQYATANLIREVIALTGSRNVYEVEQAPGKQNITVMFAFGASGVVVPSHVILPGQRIRKEVAQGFPANWGLGQSDRGWMDTHNFREYIVKIFHPSKTLEVADVCQSLGIVLISLYPTPLTSHNLRM
ncbi:uncharacterized protein LOC129773032 [Toxorhynchites rutilus septentrionalis]|uniref:uncharacterized protein LOC129773032 n=1 Tax=Toxorhynchites rutilus septentrionalis TaxID=329112 RepID=UPI00247A1700|nr:uncharacterized protein LOC129773032 [Toxorhynchites rutilus septentrionalis]